MSNEVVNKVVIEVVVKDEVVIDDVELDEVVMDEVVTPPDGAWTEYVSEGVEMRMMMVVMAVVSCEGDDDGVDSRDDGVEIGRCGEVAVVERAMVVRW
ncbi:hypothetical protein Tco_1139809 [Tanacetum coccineum]